MAAVLLRMIGGYVLYRDSNVPAQRRIAFQARRWIFYDDARSDQLDKLMTFSGLCEILDLSPELFREKIKQLRREDFIRKTREFSHADEKKEEDVDASDSR